MGPEGSHLKLKNGAEVELMNDDKKTVYLEAKLSNTHPQFKTVLKNKGKDNGKTFQRHGRMRSMLEKESKNSSHRPQKG